MPAGKPTARALPTLAALLAATLSACAPGGGLPTLADGVDALSYDVVDSFAVPSAGKEGVVFRRRSDGSAAFGFRNSPDRSDFPGLIDPRLVGMFQSGGDTVVAVEGRRACGVSYVVAAFGGSGGSAAPIGDCGVALDFGSESPTSVAAIDRASGRGWRFQNRRVTGPLLAASAAAQGGGRARGRQWDPSMGPNYGALPLGAFDAPARRQGQSPAAAPAPYVRSAPALPPVSGGASAGSVVRGPAREDAGSRPAATGRFMD